jgi:hypothetical protein
MHDGGIYTKFEKADGFMFFLPVHWYSTTSMVKLMLDRLVCANKTMTAEEAKQLFGDDYKNQKVTTTTDDAREHDHLLQNHLEGKTAAIFMHGDGGADEHQRFTVPLSFQDAKSQGRWEPTTRQAADAIAWTMLWMGVYVPEDLIFAEDFNHGLSYAEANDVFRDDQRFYEAGRMVANKLVNHLLQKEVGFR